MSTDVPLQLTQSLEIANVRKSSRRLTWNDTECRLALHSKGLPPHVLQTNHQFRKVTRLDNFYCWFASQDQAGKADGDLGRHLKGQRAHGLEGAARVPPHREIAQNAIKENAVPGPTP